MRTELFHNPSALLRFMKGDPNLAEQIRSMNTYGKEIAEFLVELFSESSYNLIYKEGKGWYISFTSEDGEFFRFSGVNKREVLLKCLQFLLTEFC